jgi:AbrB family looped-hinge helix DNA binding protein
METTVTKRGRTIIPASIRRRHQIEDGVQLIWVDDGETIRIFPAGPDPIQALRGRGRGKNLTERLLEERRRDGDRENALF